MRCRFLVRAGGWAFPVLVFLAGCHTPPPGSDAPVRASFATFKAALAANRSQAALNCLDTFTYNYLQSAARRPSTPNAPDGEVRELIHQAIAKITPGGVQPGFTPALTLQKVLDDHWISPRDLDGFEIGPLTVEGNRAHGEIYWQHKPTLMDLDFVQEGGVWKIDLANLPPYAEMALGAERLVRGESVEQQIAWLIGQIPPP